jgi:hypothetical protein
MGRPEAKAEAEAEEKYSTPHFGLMGMLVLTTCIFSNFSMDIRKKQGI